LELRNLGDVGLAIAVKPLAVAIAAVTLVRLVVAARLPLAPDETYYWIWSRALAGGYLDHPPMVALWIRAGTALIGQTALGVRVMGPMAAALASWMLFDAARALFISSNAGTAAVLLLNGSLLLGVGTVIMTPDSPLLFFWTATLWAVARLAAGGSGTWWLVAGLAAGLALDSKYTALFLWVGVGLWVLLVPSIRPWLRRWQPWAACAIGLVLFVPVMFWNAAHHWAGFARQGGRVDDWRPARAVAFLAELVGGQIGLATPVVWVLCLAGLVAAIRQAWQYRDPGWSLLVALSLPPILVFVQHAIGDRVQGNWPAIIYPALTVAAGGMAMRRRWWTGAAALGFAITALTYLQAATSLIPLPKRLDPVAMRLTGWDRLASDVEALRIASDVDFVAADGYALASELAWWMPVGVYVVSTDPRWRLLNLPSARVGGRIGLLVEDSRRRPDRELWDQAEQVGTAGRVLSEQGSFVLYRVRPRIGTEAIALPCRCE
jgi:4-amino-4-deoxy-L-arabinose transferase-like glycosyltransferase